MSSPTRAPCDADGEAFASDERSPDSDPVEDAEFDELFPSVIEDLSVEDGLGDGATLRPRFCTCAFCDFSLHKVFFDVASLPALGQEGLSRATCALARAFARRFDGSYYVPHATHTPDTIDT